MCVCMCVPVGAPRNLEEGVGTSGAGLELQSSKAPGARSWEASAHLLQVNQNTSHLNHSSSLNTDQEAWGAINNYYYMIAHFVAHGGGMFLDTPVKDYLDYVNLGGKTHT